MSVWTVIAALWLVQPSSAPTLTPALARSAAGPQFALDCPNPEPHPVPESDSLNDIALRLNGKELPPPSGGIIGSIVGLPGVDPVIAPRASVRMHFTLAQDSKDPVRSGRFGSRFTVGRLVPIAAGRHRLAVRCLGQWSNEISFEWEP